MNATDATAAVFGTLISLLLFAGLYVWTALALSAVFRKSGVEAWKAWVPVLNTIVLLQLAGLSPWLVVLAFVPFVGIAFLVVWAIALYRVNVAFGFGAGMTVLGFLLLPVWASIVGWGSARWVGRETDAANTRAPFGAGVRRSSGETATLPPLPPFPAPGAPTQAGAHPPAPTAVPPVPTSAGAGFAPPTVYAPQAPVAAAPEPEPAPASAPAAAAPGAPQESAAADVTPPAAGWTPPPLPGRPVSAAPAEAGGNGTGDADPWQGFALDGIDLSAEVTGAVPGAPAPISAVPATPLASLPTAAASPAPAGPARTGAESFTPPDAATTGEEGITRPPVTRVPAAPSAGDEREPWAPARSPMSEADAFPETSGPVSAIYGVPDVGSPRSARSSVSAFHSKPEIPDEQDILEETIIARRKRTDWALVPPTGEPVALSSEIVILGRRPAADPDHPSAQLVSIQDGTVSKTHARLRLRDDKWYVTDLDSTNGVLFATVMGTEVEAPPGEEVEAGDRFLLGDAEVRLRRSDG
ncbi:hypothetical protein J2X03_003496 [Microbacterium trichothecenolyticum]|uniref:DUF5684 domain-containing protein n=1 Tax=Microbacterium trichothecenolyticum TaxID=69370 RepID=UPI00285ACA14|nr:DUF5684 domain-containing protein [Microbacterium trichothecenolyticum]MDR7113596.1 hypothetical protein [Microbacterium trichothecenolyticum]